MDVKNSAFITNTQSLCLTFEMFPLYRYGGKGEPIETRTTANSSVWFLPVVVASESHVFCLHTSLYGVKTFSHHETTVIPRLWYATKLIDNRKKAKRKFFVVLYCVAGFFPAFRALYWTEQACYHRDISWLWTCLFFVWHFFRIYFVLYRCSLRQRLMAWGAQWYGDRITRVYFVVQRNRWFWVFNILFK